jgi:hypothetical protein
MVVTKDSIFCKLCLSSSDEGRAFLYIMCVTYGLPACLRKKKAKDFAVYRYALSL